MKARIGFKFPVTDVLQLRSIFDWWYLIIWYFSDATEYPEYDTVTQMCSAQAQYSASKSLMHTIWIEDKDADQDVGYCMIPIVEHWISRRCFVWKLGNEQSLIWIWMGNVHLVHPKLTKYENAQLITIVVMYTALCASDELRVDRRRLACCISVSVVTKNQNDFPGQSYSEWWHSSWVASAIFGWLRVSFLWMIVHNSVEYPEPEQVIKSSDTILSNELRNHYALRRTPSTWKVVLWYSPAVQVQLAKWWLT